jgi:glycosyltransferase involved in cell wall biosynthesis
MTGSSWGGSEELWSQAAARLAGNGNVVAARVLWWPDTPPRIAELLRCHIKLHFHYRKRPLRTAAARLVDLLRTASWRPDHGWLDRFRPDLVVISSCIHTSGFRIAEACRRRNIPYSIIVQSAGEMSWPDDRRCARLADAYAHAKKVFLVAEENGQLIENQLAIRLDRAAVVRNPFNVSYEARPAWPGGRTTRLACVARLEPSAKGQDILLDVLRRPKWKDRPVSLSLFGTGANAERLRQLVRRVGLENVAFNGFEPDVEKIWATHHALVLPSRFEGTPLAVVEAMLCARPSIVTRVAGRDLVEDGINGFVAPAPTAQLLDEALERAWERRDEWEAIGRCAATTIRKQVPPDPVGEFVEQLKSLLPPGPSPR